MKKSIVILLTLRLLLSIAACGAAPAKAPEATPAEEAGANAPAFTTVEGGKLRDRAIRRRQVRLSALSQSIGEAERGEHILQGCGYFKSENRYRSAQAKNGYGVSAFQSVSPQNSARKLDDRPHKPQKIRPDEAEEKALELLETVGLKDRRKPTHQSFREVRNKGLQ